MKTSTIPTLLGPDGMTSLREYAGYHGGGSGFGGQLVKLPRITPQHRSVWEAQKCRT